MDFSKLSQNQQIALGGGVLAIVASFFPWFSEEYVSINAWETPFFGWIGTVLVIGSAVLLGLKAFDVQNVRVANLEAEQISLLAAGAGLVLTFIQFAFGYDFRGISVGRSLGIYVAIIAAAAVTYGIYGTMKDEGLDIPSADDFKPDD